jgi:hypothetical protein
MSGVEVAGLVLGALPLLLAGLQLYAEGIAVTRRYGKYREEINSLLDDLKAEKSVYQNSIETLLLGIVDAKDVEEFIAHPGGELWKAPIFERKLRKRLGTSYNSYLDTILRLQTTAEKFRERLKLGSSGQVHCSFQALRYSTDVLQPEFSQPQAFKEHYKRLKFSLSKAGYSDLMVTIRHANTVLHRLTFQRQNIESQQRATRVTVPNFKRINDRAQNFLSILTSGWNCHCQADHAVSLRLEPRMEDVQSDDDDGDNEGELLMRDPFHVLFRYGPCPAAASDIREQPWTWDEAEIHVIHDDPASTTAAMMCDDSSAKGVRFASQAKKAVKAALDPTPNLQPIKDLCSAMHTLQKPQRDVCLILLENEIAKQKYRLKIFPTKTLPQNTNHWSVSTLRSALQRGRRFSKRDRVRLAVILASSVLQLHKTPWLDDDWDIDNIYFVERPGIVSYDQPFVSPGLHTSVTTSADTLPQRHARMIRNKPLFALGVALIELWYGESLSDLHEVDDGPQHPIELQSRLLTRFNTADRLADELADDAGTRYSDAVRRCIRCDFSLQVNDFEDVHFQKAVFQGVVAKLKESYDFMTGLHES